MDEIERIDWAQPWYAAITQHGAGLNGTRDLLSQLNRLLSLGMRPSTQSCKALLFAPAGDAGSVPYETHVYETGRVPTRENLHDLFNALAWLAFPRLKARLNGMHAHALTQPLLDASAGRGGLRDAATLLDENGAIVACASEEVALRLRRFDWQSLFVSHRAEWLVHTETWVCGHALMEKLHRPYKAISAHALIVPVEPHYFELPKEERLRMVDEAAAAWLTAVPLTSGAFCPLPVLGIPGWWNENSDTQFYEDPFVFRSGRRRVTGF